jgi:hypothetical protein
MIEIQRKETIKMYLSIFMSSLEVWLLPAVKYIWLTINDLSYMIVWLGCFFNTKIMALFVVHSWSLFIWPILKIQKITDCLYSLMYVTTVFSIIDHKLSNVQQCIYKWHLFAFLYSMSVFSVIFNYQLRQFMIRSGI